jgi:hypothetical protein
MAFQQNVVLALDTQMGLGIEMADDLAFVAVRGNQKSSDNTLLLQCK